MRVGVVFPQTEIGADPVGIPSPISGTIASVPPKPESTEGGRRVSVLKRQEGAPVLLG